MNSVRFIFIYGFFYFLFAFGVHYERKPHSVLVALFARNKEHTLPYFLSLFSQINYSKNRISLFIRSDHNQDRTNEIIKEWLAVNKKYYHSIDVILDEKETEYSGEGSKTNWTTDRFTHIIKLKDEALAKAVKIWADYIWFLDVDAFILEPNILLYLMNENKPIAAPMLRSLGTYSNYWCGMSSSYWYVRTDDYLPILEYKKTGCFNVPMVHSSVLIDLTYVDSLKLTFNFSIIPNYDGPLDDIISFAISAKKADLSMFVCNHRKFGFLPPPLDPEDDITIEHQHIVDLKLDSLIEFPLWPLSRELRKYMLPIQEKSKLGFDNIYLINLRRRPDRLKRMIDSFNELGIESEVFSAIDGQSINTSYIKELGIKQLSNYKDPWWKRDMKYGEIGCFLSHYFIWQEIVKNNYEKVIIFEDDIRFEPSFKDKLSALMDELDRLRLKWDLVYLGRKILKNANETWVSGTDMIVTVDYSHWTLCYMLSLEGAKKLLKPQPLQKMVPVDEYLPIMFDRHTEESWKREYYPRNLRAYSVNPLLVSPTHYTGQDGYISDTESSSILDEETLKENDLPIGPPFTPTNHFSVDRESYSGLDANEL